MLQLRSRYISPKRERIMSYHLENEIMLIEKNGDWFIQEFDKDGNKIGGEQVPWRWGLYFTADELHYSYSMKISDESDTDNNAHQNEDEEVITAILRPGHCSSDKYLRDKVTYSMFGTNRTINKFHLCIYKCETEIEDDNEKCRMWGEVSSTSENVNFEVETTDDEMGITLYLSPEQFDIAAETIKAKRINILEIYLARVFGFYSSEWSRMITTEEIKVLTNLECQKVITPHDCKIEPHTLGKIGKCYMRLIQHHKFNLKGDP